MIQNSVVQGIERVWKSAEGIFGVHGLLGRTWSTSVMAFWATFLLAICLVVYYLQ